MSDYRFAEALRNADAPQTIGTIILRCNLLTFNDFMKLVLRHCKASRDDLTKEDIVEFKKQYKRLELSPLKLAKCLGVDISTNSIDNLPRYLFKNDGSTKYRSVTTVNGYRFDVMKSGLQKYIRRGMTQKAVYCAVEMLMFSYMKGGQAATTNFLNRLRIICLEDIGLGCPEMPRYIDYMMENLDVNVVAQENYSGLASSNLDSLVTIVYAMSNCLHSRLYSHIRNFCRDKKNVHFDNDFKHDYDLGENTMFRKDVNSLISCLKKKHISAFYFIEKIFNSEEKLVTKKFGSTKPRFLVMDILKQMCKRQSYEEYDFEVCLKWAKILKTKEAHLCAVHVAYTYILHDDIWENASIKEQDDIFVVNPRQDYSLNLLNKKIEIDGYVIDKHTHQGRARGKNTADFALEGSLVAFEDGLLATKYAYLREKYIQARVHEIGEKVPLESEVFKLKARAQLTCSNARPDVYYAYDRSTKKNVVVKGPFLEYEDVRKSYNIFRVMSLFKGVNTPGINVKLLIPDMFDKVGVGVRNKAKKGKEYYFLVFDDIFDEEEYPTEMKSSKCWEPTEVVDYVTLFKKRHNKIGFATPSTMDEKAKVSLVIQLGWRCLFKLGDFAARNFCYSGDKAYNLDADNLLVNNTVKFKGEDCKELVKCFERNMEEVVSHFQSWGTLDDAEPEDAYEDIPTALNKWYMIKRTFMLSDKDIEEMKEFVSNGIYDVEKWLARSE